MPTNGASRSGGGGGSSSSSSGSSSSSETRSHQGRQRALVYTSLLVFLTQATFCFTLMIASIYNLTTDAPNKPLWSALLSGALGYMLPSPKLKRDKHIYTTWAAGVDL